MAAFDFPSSPNVNDIYTLNGVAFMWNGSVWKRYSTSTGAQGFQGAAGAAGAQGAQGTNGTIGSDGAQGAQGHQGATGSGATGAQGAAGATGAQGAAGAQGAPFDRSEYNYTASGGQTAFAAAYANASDVDVFMNGVRLTPAEYTPSGGTTITLASGATAGDIIDILTFASAGPTGAQGAQGHQGDAFNRSESNFTATSGQTSFAPSGGYTNGDDLDVFVNGVRLTPADYTATNGTNVVLDVGANTGDIVDIIYYEAAGPAGAQGAAGIAGTVTFSTSAPSNPINGDLWYDTDDGAFAGYYDDGNTSQWIDLSGGPRGAQGAQGAAGSIPSNITAVNGTFSGNVSIGGTLTYEDVTNIDSVGVVTARNGIDVTGGTVTITTGANSASPAGSGDNLVIKDSNGCGLSILSGNGNSQNIYLGSTSDNDAVRLEGFYNSGSPYFNIYTAGLERLRIDDAGRLTISGQGLKLSTNNSSLYSLDGSLSYYATNNAVYLNGAGTNGWLRLNAAGTENNQNAINIFGGNAGAHIDMRTNNVERIRITSDGKIGINETSPTARLDINHPNTEPGLVVRSRYGNIATAMVKFDGDPDSNGGDGNVLHLHGGSSRTDSEILHIDSTGVGDIFDIRGDGLTRVYKQLQLEHSSNVAKIIFNEYGANDPKAQIEMDQINGSSGQLIFRTQDSGTLSERLRITADGKTGIGGITPQNLLNVNATGSMGLYGTTAGKTGHSIKFIRKYGSSATHNFAVINGASPHGQSRLGGFVATYTFRSAYGFDSDGGGHGVRMLSGRVRDSGEWGFDQETSSGTGDSPRPYLQGVDNNNGTCTLQVVNPSSTHSYGEFHIVAWDCQITTPST